MENMLLPPHSLPKISTNTSKDIYILPADYKPLLAIFGTKVYSYIPHKLVYRLNAMKTKTREEKNEGERGKERKQRMKFTMHLMAILHLHVISWPSRPIASVFAGYHPVVQSEAEGWTSRSCSKPLTKRSNVQGSRTTYESCNPLRCGD